jgi:hypothetical protein
MQFIHLVLIFVFGVVLGACGEDAPERPVSTPTPQPSTTNEQSQPAVNPRSAPASQSAGGVTVQILPENPTSTGCLRAVIQGHPGRSAVIWMVNGETVSSGIDTQLCSDNYQRYDQVSVAVGTNDKGAQTSVSIGNSLPRVVDISSTPEEIFAGTDITVQPIAEDTDGDDVDFTYQWLINGEADPALTEATLPGSRFSKGDTVQVLIVPNDFYDDGPTYESYAMQVPNAAPSITSQPPQGITSLDYRYQVVVGDPDDSQFTYRLDEAPDGMIIDAASGLIQWSLVDIAPGDYTIAIIVTDPEGAEGAQEYTLTLNASE